MPTSTTTLQVTFVSESAAYDNTFGWYNSQTGMGGILFADVEQQGSNPPLTPGATVTFTVNTADLPYIQFFLVPDGADRNHNDPDDLTGAIKVIQLADGSWAVADVDSMGNVIYIHGRPDTLQGQGADALFTETSKNAGGIDYASSTVGPNQTPGTLGGDTADGPTGLLAWEDTAAKLHAHVYGAPGDADYNDAVFNIVALNHPPETNAASATGNEDTTIAITLSGTDDDGTVTSFDIITLPANGTLYSDAALTHVIAAGDTVTASGNAATVYFVPNANFNGDASFQYAAIDDDGAQDATPATASITVVSVNDAPSGADHSVTINEDGSYTFATSDFGFTDPNDTPANALLAVKITTLPGAGTLTDNGVAVTAGQFVSAADIAAGLVKFTPAANGNGAGYGTFTFQVQDNGGAANGGVDLDQSPNTMTINVTSVNDAPSGTNNTVTTNEDIAYTFAAADFGFTDPNDTPANALLAVKITTLPGAGSLTDNGVAVTAGQSVSVADINAGLLKFTPAANANGAGYASFTFQVQDNGGTANGGVDLDQSPNTMTVNVISVNDAPSGANNTVTTNEDIAYTFAAADFGFTDPNDTPANALLAVTITTLPGAGSLTDNGIAVTAGQSVSVVDINAGLLKFTPAANANGAAYANFTFQVQDNGGTTNGGVDLDQSPNTMTVNVNSVNDAPVGADATVHSGSMYVFSTSDFGFSDPNDTPANNFAAVEITTLPTSGTLTDNGNAVHAGDFIPVADINNGLLQFTAAGGANASFTFQVRDDGGTANGGVDLDQSSNTFTLIVNTPPVANDDSVAATEAGGLNNTTPGHDPSGNVVLGTGDAGNVQDTDAQDPSSALVVVATGTGVEGSADNGTVGTAFNGLHGSLLLGSNGIYSYTLNQTDAAVQALHTAADTVTDVFHYTIQDSGGLTDSATLTITIHGANDLPQAFNDAGSMTEDDGPTSFNVIANDTLDPDSTAANTISVGAVTVTGPAGETFANTDAQATVVANQIRVTLNNANFQQLALGEHATVTVPYTLTGDAGDTSSANLVVTVNGVNDVPVAADDSGTMTEDQSGTAFTVLTNDTLDPDHGAPNNVTAGAVSNVSAPAGEGIDAGDVGVSVNASNQIVVTLGSDFQHLQDGETASFDVAYTLHGDQPGDLATATLHVTVTGANDAPTVSNVTFIGASSANYNTDLVVNDPADGAPTTTGPFKGITASLLSLSNASDADGPNPLSFTPLNNVLTADGGHVTLQADGDFIYTPRVGTTATSDSFSFTVTDGNSGPSGPGTASATATITLQGPHIWYVNADGPDGDGSSEHPFSTLAHFAGAGGVDHAGDIIFLESASNHYTGGITLENNEQLISQSAGLVVPDGAGGAGTVTLQAAGGTNVVVDGGVVLGTGNNIQGVDFGSASGYTLSGTNVGTVHVDDVTQGAINNASGGGVSIDGPGSVLSVSFSSITAGGGAAGIKVGGGASGSFTSGNLNITNSTLAGVDIDGSSGSFSFTGSSNVVNTGSHNAVIFNNSTGSLSFTNGGLDIDTTSGNGFTATGGGTVTVQGTGNHVTTTTGTAVNITNTAIGSGNVTFQDISANGATNGIVLNNTGTGASNGGLVVTGDGGSTNNSSGGTIQHTSGAGILLSSTKNVSLDQMEIHDTAQSGINGTGVTNFTFTNGTIDHSGTGAPSGSQFSNIQFGSGSGNNIAGTVTITGNKLTNAYFSGVAINSDAGTVTDANISNNTITSGTTTGAGGTSFGSGIFISGAGNASTVFDLNQAELQNNQINNFPGGSGILVQLGNTNAAGPGAVAGHFDKSSVIDISGNVISGASTANLMGGFGIGAVLSGSTGANRGQGYFDIHGNTVSNVAGTGIGVGANDNVDLRVITDSNTIHAHNINASAGIGGGNGTLLGVNTVTPHLIWGITNNTIDSTDGSGILAVGRGTSGTLDLDVENNNVATPTSSTTVARRTVEIEAGNAASANDTVHLQIFGNTVGAGLNGAGAIGVRKQGNNPAVNVFGVYDAPGGPSLVANPTNAQVQAFIAALNPGAPSVDVLAGPGYQRDATHNDPLHAAAGGIASALGTAGTMNLTQAELDPIVAAAIAQWAAAGLGADQLAALHATSVTIAPLAASVLGEAVGNAIQISPDAAGYGWFVDSTPSDNAEFTHMLGTAGTDFLTDPTNAAAGHMDLLTAVVHEMGHMLGLPDSVDVSGLMHIDLVAGERRLASAADVAAATENEQASSQPQTVASGQTVTGTAGADTFVVDPSTVLAQQGQPIAHVAGYSAAQGDTFDFSALTQTNLPSGLAAALASGDLRVAEDAGGTFATLQIHDGTGAGDWFSVAQLDGVHAGDPVNVALDAANVLHLQAVVFA